MSFTYDAGTDWNYEGKRGTGAIRTLDPASLLDPAWLLGDLDPNVPNVVFTYDAGDTFSYGG